MNKVIKKYIQKQLLNSAKEINTNDLGDAAIIKEKFIMKTYYNPKFGHTEARAYDVEALTYSSDYLIREAKLLDECIQIRIKTKNKENLKPFIDRINMEFEIVTKPQMHASHYNEDVHYVYFKIKPTMPLLVF